MLLDDVAALIETLGLGTVKTSAAQAGVPWLIYKAGEVPGEADAISLNESPGEGPLHAMGETVAELPHLQVIARSLSYLTARTKAAALWTALNNYRGTPVATRYLGIELLHSPFPVGRDNNARWLLAFNCRVTKELG
jgi:hypothetical protein